MMISETKSIAVVGAGGSGKTGLVLKLLSESDKPVYIYIHQGMNQNIVKRYRELGFIPSFSLGDLNTVQDAIYYIDEPQLVMKFGDKKQNEGLKRLLTIARHRDITLVISTCDTQFITRSLEGQIETWLIKDIELMTAKQGSMIKKIIQKFWIGNEDDFMLSIDQYLFYSRKNTEKNGVKLFEKPVWFDEELSKPFKLKEENGFIKVAKELRSKVRQ